MHELEKIKLIAGLGNPGKEYSETYHNMGIAALEEIVGRSDDAAKPKRFKDLFAHYEIGGKIFLKPLCFMNESGAVLKTALKRFDIKPEELLVIHDDSDIEIGNFKLSFGRNSGGHKGVESVIKSLRAKNFWRLRIGIRPQAQTDADYTQNNAENSPRKSAFGQRKSATQRAKAKEFVLKQISSHDKKIFLSVFKKITEKISHLLDKPETH